MKTIVARSQCPTCAATGGDKSRNNLVNYSDGGSYCYACGFFVSDGKASVSEEDNNSKENRMPDNTLENILRKRGISITVAQKYGVTLVENNGELKVRVPITDTSGQEISAQYREVDTSSGNLTRNMTTAKGGKLKVPCFGVNTITKNTKVVLICEGWTDALIAATAIEGRLDISVLGLCGATFAKRAAMFVSRYHDDKRIVLAFDNDEAGDKAKQAFIEASAQYSPDKVLHKLLIPQAHKDLGEWLEKAEVNLLDAIENSPPVFSSNLLTSDQVGDRLHEFLNKLTTEEYIRLNFSPTLDRALKLMPGKLLGILGDAGQGKSTFAEHLMLEAITQKKRVFCLSAEMAAEEVALKLMRTVKREPLHLPDYLRSLDKSYFAEVVAETKRVLTWLTLVDDFGVCSVDRVDSYLLELAAADRMPSLVVVDHLLAIAESLEPDVLQKTCMLLKGLARKHRVCIVLLCHIKKPQEQSRRTINRPMLSAAYGSIGLAMYCDAVVAVAKDPQKRLTFVETVKQERLIGEYADVTLSFEDWQLAEVTTDSSPNTYDSDSADVEEETDAADVY